MVDETELAQLEERWNVCKAQDERKATLFSDLMERVTALSQKLADSKQELEEKRVFIKSMNQNKVEMVKQIEALQAEKDKHSFALVLIDGDCMPFVDNLVQDGFEGGRKAARLFQEALDGLRSSESSLPHHMQFVVRVYANLQGLSQKYHIEGLVSQPESFLDFVRGFNMGVPNCDYVDAGNGKECADTKLKGSLGDVHCRRILFGGSPDNGYTRLLSQYLDNAKAREKIVLVEGPRFAHELAVVKNGFRIVSFPSIFRAQMLPDTNNKRRTTSQLTPPTTPSIGYAAAVARASSPSTSTSASHHGPTEAPGAGVVHRNRAGERVDVPLNCSSREVNEMRGRKMCNNFHLTGYCHFMANKGKCQHKHGTRFTGKELLVLRAVARHSPCYAGLSCNDPSCNLGHRCPLEHCTKQDCKFPPELHNVDRKIVE